MPREVAEGGGEKKGPEHQGDALAPPFSGSATLGTPVTWVSHRFSTYLSSGGQKLFLPSSLGYCEELMRELALKQHLLNYNTETHR